MLLLVIWVSTAFLQLSQHDMNTDVPLYKTPQPHESHGQHDNRETRKHGRKKCNQNITLSDVPFVGSSVAHTCSKIPRGECNGLDLDNYFISAPRQETLGQ